MLHHICSLHTWFASANRWGWTTHSDSHPDTEFWWVVYIFRALWSPVCTMSLLGNSKLVSFCIDPCLPPTLGWRGVGGWGGGDWHALASPWVLFEWGNEWVNNLSHSVKMIMVKRSWLPLNWPQHIKTIHVWVWWIPPTSSEISKE